MQRLPADELLRRFESLGYNCEFGLVQRFFHVDAPGLLRWGHVQTGFEGLIQAFDRRFDAIGDHVTLHDVNGECISRDDTFGIVFHTERGFGTIDAEKFLQAERHRLKFLGRSLIDLIADEEPILVYHGEVPLSAEDMRRLKAALDRIGSCALLWVTVAEPERQGGRVDAIEPGLYQGWLDRFSPRHDVNSYCAFDVWLSICRQAFALWQDEIGRLRAA